MRATRSMLALLCGSLLLPLATPARANHAVTAQTHGVVWPEGDYARVVVLCSGRTEQVTRAARTVVLCEIFDSSGKPSIRRQRSSAGPACACVLNAYLLEMPITICVTATVTFTDLTEDTDVDCQTYETPAPPRNPPSSPYNPLECLDPAGVGVWAGARHLGALAAVDAIEADPNQAPAVVRDYVVKAVDEFPL